MQAMSRVVASLAPGSVRSFSCIPRAHFGGDQAPSAIRSSPFPLGLVGGGWLTWGSRGGGMATAPWGSGIRNMSTDLGALSEPLRRMLSMDNASQEEKNMMKIREVSACPQNMSLP
jgi:hypothetical protein